jgi:hypothetical protein
MRDTAIHDPASNPLPLDAWLVKQRKFGVAASEKHLVVGADEVGEVTLFDPA